jgi:hypothetical protein
MWSSARAVMQITAKYSGKHASVQQPLTPWISVSVKSTSHSSSIEPALYEALNSAPRPPVRNASWTYNRLSGEVLATLVAAAKCPRCRLFVHVASLVIPDAHLRWPRCRRGRTSAVQRGYRQQAVRRAGYLQAGRQGFPEAAVCVCPVGRDVL